ncbi:protein kinase domain-containing protein [Embleya scabrispora]|uniref:protein kinase domain-containing protein n=1 Tax=Embleya scabrispora TaxID=159449 RepID=UPI00131A3A7A|nr:protein kinase [Embleya scabrispora]MYS79750.1 protein kinase [Streptomyces sp. SID5474]
MTVSGDPARANGRVFGGGRYRTGRRIGGGGMAVVHEAHDLMLDRVVAVKRLRSDLAEDTIARSRFAREAEHAAALNHPTIVSVFDTGADPGEDGVLVPWIVMELIQGLTLRDLLEAHGPVPWPRALAITAKVLDALEYSHDRGLVHRDIKPVNVMITPGGAVKVMDFGIARALFITDGALTDPGRIMGTPQYFSPEQAFGHPASTRSDLYSVGCLLHELLVGVPPFDGGTAVHIAYRHMREEPTPPSAYRPDVPGAVDDLVLHALRKDPHLRFDTAGRMRESVRRILPEDVWDSVLYGAGVPAPPAGSPGPAMSVGPMGSAAPIGQRPPRSSGGGPPWVRVLSGFGPRARSAGAHSAPGAYGRRSGAGAAFAATVLGVLAVLASILMLR